MKRNRRIRLTYANVVASLALFAALGGSSYAAVSITGKQVRDGSLAGRDVGNGSLTGKDVRDRSLLASDFKSGQLPAGPQGPKGDKGDKGDTGATGSPGLSGLAIVKESTTGPYAAQSATAFCPDGKRAIAVSGDTAGALGKVALTDSDVVNAVVNGNHISAGSVSAQTIGGVGVGDWTITAIVTCAYAQ